MYQDRSDRYHLRFAYESRIGGRAENQDDCGYAETPLGFLFVVCDGMGGGPGGRTASSAVKAEVISTLLACTPQMPPTEALKLAVDRAQTALEARMQADPRLAGMGSTLVAVLISEQSALVAHLGDSRCYRVGDGRMKFRTADHSLVGELVQYGSMTEEQARLSPQSNVITRGLGATNNHVAQIDEVPYRRGDRFVLCTDGVWGIMPQSNLLQYLTAKVPIEDLAFNLPDEVDHIGANEGGHHDNHTLAIIEMNIDSILRDKLSRREILIGTVMLAIIVISVFFNVLLASRLIKQGTKLIAAEKRLDSLTQCMENESIIRKVDWGNLGEAHAKIARLEVQVKQLQDSLDLLRTSVADDENIALANNKLRAAIDSALVVIDRMMEAKPRKGDPDDWKEVQKADGQEACKYLRKIDEMTERRFAKTIKGWIYELESQSSIYVWNGTGNWFTGYRDVACSAGISKLEEIKRGIEQSILPAVTADTE